VYEDEFALLSAETRAKVLTPSPFSTEVNPNPPYLEWSRWSANKHLVCLLAKHADETLRERDAQRASLRTIDHLKEAQKLHATISSEGVSLTDNTNAYQHPWRAAVESLVSRSEIEFELLRMLGEL